MLWQTGSKGQVSAVRFAAPVLLALLLCAMLAVFLAPPDFEAHAVVQIGSAGDTVPMMERQLTSRGALEATAARQSLAGADVAVTLRKAIALHELTSDAGIMLGLPAETTGVVISVRMQQADQATRVANDLALQVLDLGQNGALDAGHSALSFYRSEESRLWQELAALNSERRADSARVRQAKLLQDQYDVVRRRLAEAEVDARLAARQSASQFTLLARADQGRPVRDHAGLLAALAALAAAVAVLALRDNRRIVTAWRRMSAAPGGQVFGLPRSLALGVALVGLVIGLSVSIH